jgi:hypothetical protein
MRTLHNSRALSTTIGLLVAGLVAVNAAWAIPGGLGGTSKRALAHAAQVAELKAARSLLEKADHDYQGHRAQAVHEIGVAIHALQGSHQHHAMHKSTGGNNESQAASDAQLRQALKKMKTVESQLQGGSSGGHTAKAAAAVKKAIQELETALKIR